MTKLSHMCCAPLCAMVLGCAANPGSEGGNYLDGIPPFPNEWEAMRPKVSGSECASLSGRFADAPEVLVYDPAQSVYRPVSTSAWSVTSLNWLMNADKRSNQTVARKRVDPPIPREKHWFEITHPSPNQTQLLTLHYGGHESTSKVFSLNAGDYSCVGAAFIFREFRIHGGGDGVTINLRVGTRATKLSDGSLVFERKAGPAVSWVPSGWSNRVEIHLIRFGPITNAPY